MSYCYLAFSTNVLLNLYCPGHLSYFSPNESEPLYKDEEIKHLLFVQVNKGALLYSVQMCVFEREREGGGEREMGKREWGERVRERERERKRERERERRREEERGGRGAGLIQTLT